MVKLPYAVDRNSAAPLHYQISQSVKNYIKVNKLKPGDKIPSEKILCNMFGFSRTTVRHGIDQLVREGMLIRRRAKGTFICDTAIDRERGYTKLLSSSKQFKEAGVGLDTKKEISKLEFDLGHVNRDGSLPLYMQVESMLRNKIESGQWTLGQCIPSEQKLAEKFGVSISTVKAAIKNLINRGFLYRKKGKGTYVTKPKIQEAFVQKVIGYYEDMSEKGYLLYSKILSLFSIPASLKIAEKLKIEKGQLVIHIKRLRYVNDEPLCIVFSYYPYELCPDLLNEDLSKQSVYKFLERKYGLYIASARRTLEAVAATKEEAKLLEVKEGAPIQLIESVACIDTGRTIEYYKALHRGDRSKFEIEATRTQGNI